MSMLRRVWPRFRIQTPILPTTTRLATRPFIRPFRTSVPRHSENAPPNTTVSQRLKHLVKSYGWYALGVYLGFSALDFTVAFVGIKFIGAEQVSQAAAYVKQAAYGFLHTTPPALGRDDVDSSATASDGHEGLYAMLVLAYTIHKTLFLPVRVGLTAALTPRIVGWLRARGWAGGEGAKQAAREIKERLQNTRGRN